MAWVVEKRQSNQTQNAPATSGGRWVVSQPSFTKQNFQQPKPQQPSGFSDNSWQGILKNTVKGVFSPQTYKTIGNQIVNHPADTAASVGSGIYKGLDETFGKVLRATNPVTYIPFVAEAQKKYRETSPFLNYKPKNDVSSAIQSGWEMGGQMPAYTVGGEFAKAIPALAKFPRLTNYLGFEGTSQATSDLPITDFRGRAKLAGTDALMFAVTGGLRKPKIRPIDDYIKAQSPTIKSQPPQEGGNILKTKGDITTPNINYRKFIEENLGIRDKTTRIPGIDTKIRGIERKLAEPQKLLVQDIASETPLAKDIGNMAKGMQDVYRNFKTAFGENYGKVKKSILDPFDKSKGDFVDTQKKWLGELKTKIVDNMGFSKGSKKSADLQKFGEGLISPADIVAKYGKGELGNFIHADNWFRKSYKQLLTDVNETLKKIYPNQPEKLIPERQDYYRHFKEMAQGVEGLRNIFDTPAGISSKLAGISPYTKPKQKWWSAAQRRLGNETTYDATGGFLDYLKGAAYKQHIEPHISNFRNLERAIAEKTAGTPMEGKYGNFQRFLQMYADDLAGKTNPIDRAFQEFFPGGRKAIAVVNWMNNRVKANVILGNVSSAVAQVFNFPQGIAKAGIVNSTEGMARTLAGIFTKNKPMLKSAFLKERYFRGYNAFDKGILDNAKNFASWVITVLDEGATKSMWNSFYVDAGKKGIADAVKYADDMTREMVAGRGIGEVPIVQKAKMFQMVAPFQLEVQNLWHVMKDMVSEKQFGQLAEFFVLSYLFNRGAEKVRGSKVSFDPIQATADAYGIMNDEKENKIPRALGRLSGEVLSNVVGGQSLAGLYPEYGIAGLPSRKELFGSSDPTRFGTGPLFARGFQDPYAILPPFGGIQTKKTIQGGQAFNQGYGTDKSGNVTYPIEQSPQNAARNYLFGQYATPEARNYFDNNQRALSEDQSKLYTDLPQDQRGDYFNMLQQERASDKKAEDLHKKQKDMIMQGFLKNNQQMIRDAIALDPVYGTQNFTAIAKEFRMQEMSPQDKLLTEQIQYQKKKRNPFYQ